MVYCNKGKGFGVGWVISSAKGETISRDDLVIELITELSEKLPLDAQLQQPMVEAKMTSKKINKMSQKRRMIDYSIISPQVYC